MKKSLISAIVFLALICCPTQHLHSQSNSWNTIEELPLARGFSAGVELDGKIYVIGGYIGGDYNATNTVLVYDPQTGTYDNSMPDLPVPLARTTATVIDGKIYVTGGHSYDMGDNARNNLFVYDPQYNLWMEKAPMSIKRFYHESVNLDGKLVVMGGRSRTWPQPLENTVEMYDPATNTWSDLQNMNYAPGSFCAEVYNGNIYTFGGIYLSNVYTNVEMYDPVSNSWTSVGELPGGRWGNGSVVIEDEVWLFGGADDASAISNVWKWDFENEWEVLDLVVAHENATFAYASSTGPEDKEYMYAFGGTNLEYWIPNTSGPYTMKIAQNFCVDDLISTDKVTSTPNLRIELYPNPLTLGDDLYLSIDSVIKGCISIYDNKACLLDQFKVNSADLQSKTKWSTELLTRGFYIIKLDSEKGSVVEKLIVQ